MEPKKGIPSTPEEIAQFKAETAELVRRSEARRARNAEQSAETERLMTQLEKGVDQLGAMTDEALVQVKQQFHELDKEDLASAKNLDALFKEEEASIEKQEELERAGKPPPLYRVK